MQQVTGESLRRFEEASRQALEKARSDMEYNREGSLTAFQKSIEEKMIQSVEQAQVHLQAQFGPMIEALEANRQKQHQEWMQQLKKSTDESIDQYKARLENASNSWLLASATTLGQHSQTVLDTLAKAAEKRMRESIAGVLSGMGDTLKDRLMGISTICWQTMDIRCWILIIAAARDMAVTGAPQFTVIWEAKIWTIRWMVQNFLLKNLGLILST